MYGEFVREMPENVDKNKTWQWLSKCDLIGTEALLGTGHYLHYYEASKESTFPSSVSVGEDSDESDSDNDLVLCDESESKSESDDDT